MRGRCRGLVGCPAVGEWVWEGVDDGERIEFDKHSARSRLPFDGGDFFVREVVQLVDE